MAATSVHNDVCLDSEECHERETDCAHADVDTLVRSLERAGGGEMAAEVPCGVGCYRWQKWRSPTNGMGNLDGDGKI